MATFTLPTFVNQPSQAQLNAEQQARMDQSVQGLQQGIESYARSKKQDAQTKRQEAMDALKFSMQAKASGFDVSPDQAKEYIRNQTAPEPEGPSLIRKASDYLGITEAAPVEQPKTRMQDIFSSRTPEYLQKQEDMKRQRELQSLQLDEQKRKAAEAGLSFDQTREGKEFAAKEALKADIEKQKRNDPNYKLEQMGAEAKGKVGSIVSGLQALQGIAKAVGEGQQPEYIDANTPLIGGLLSDTDISRNQRVLSEVVGRLQSGGAINKDEGERFVALGPRPGDSPSVQRKKIQDQMSFLSNKLNAYGLKEEDLPKVGFDYTPQNLKQLASSKPSNGIPQGFNPVVTNQQVPFSPSQDPDMNFLNPMPSANAAGQVLIDPSNMNREQLLRFIRGN